MRRGRSVCPADGRDAEDDGDESAEREECALDR
jgi:hypothetical protein